MFPNEIIDITGLVLVGGWLDMAMKFLGASGGGKGKGGGGIAKKLLGSNEDKEKVEPNISYNAGEQGSGYIQALINKRKGNIDPASEILNKKKYV